MSTMSEKISSIMLQALSKNAKKFNCDVRTVSIFLALHENGDLVCTVWVGGLKKGFATLSELIGFMPAALAKGPIKKKLRELEIELGAKRQDVSVRIETKDEKTISVTVFNGKEQTPLAIEQLL